MPDVKQLTVGEIIHELKQFPVDMPAYFQTDTGVCEPIVELKMKDLTIPIRGNIFLAVVMM